MELPIGKSDLKYVLQPDELPMVLNNDLPDGGSEIAVKITASRSKTEGSVPPSARSGADTTLGGETNQFGFEDHEFIRDLAEWEISVSYIGVIPGCGTKSSHFQIPQGGQQIAICFLH